MLYTLSGADSSQFGFGLPRNTAVFQPTFSGAVVRSDDITKDPRYGRNAPHHGLPQGHLPVRSHLAVPVISRSGEVIGGLFFGHAEPAQFTQSHERLMTGLASQAAVSIDNARLYQELQRSNETLEQRVAERTAELATANEALRQAQKMEAIGQLTGGIAHDFNNMLTVIRGSADVLQRGLGDEARRMRYIQAIADTADRAARLTGQLLAFARRQALKPEVFDVEQRVGGIADMLRTVLGSRICLVIASTCPDCFVEADSAQFETSLVNMAVNARDAMDGEGELRLDAGRAEALPSGGTGEPARHGYICITVSDTGEGIAPDALQRIFEPFYTTKETGKGTGLGLSQVYGFANQSGGEIHVTSELGRGTSFTLFLPARPRAARRPTRRPGSDGGAARGGLHPGRRGQRPCRPVRRAGAWRNRLPDPPRRLGRPGARAARNRRALRPGVQRHRHARAERDRARPRDPPALARHADHPHHRLQRRACPRRPFLPGAPQALFARSAGRRDRPRRQTLAHRARHRPLRASASGHTRRRGLKGWRIRQIVPPADRCHALSLAAEPLGRPRIARPTIAKAARRASSARAQVPGAGAFQPARAWQVTAAS